MPPTAIEIKARLDKAVDQDGNVLDMEAVLEIVASLEKIVMTKESLEATRIGKTINLMRKKTSNEDLSRRAKKLVKRWQTVVSNHLKKVKPETLNGVVKRKEIEQQSSLNGSKIETYQTDPDVKLASKRKRNSPDNCVVKSVDFSVAKSAGLSPRSSPKNNASPKGLPPGASPKHCASPIRGVSPKIKSKIDNSKAAKPSGLVAGELGSRNTELGSAHIHRTLNSTFANDELAAELNCSELNHTHENNNEKLEYLEKNHHRQSNEHLEKNYYNDSSNNPAADTDTTITNSTDTRVQENRICLNQFIGNGTKNSLLQQTTNIEIDNQIDTMTETNEIIPNEFPPIEPEDLSLVRRELPENILSPENEADGVNGVYDPKNMWCPWDENVRQRDNELLLLPYVILD